MLDKDTALDLWKRACDLPSGEFVKGLPLELIQVECNGVGAVWMGNVHILGSTRTLLDIANGICEWALPATVRHDIRYTIGGTSEQRREDDLIFLDDCQWLANQLYKAEHWYNPMRYIRFVRRHREAYQMYLFLRAFGHHAYRFNNAADAENEEWISGERAALVGAEYRPAKATGDSTPQ